MEIAARVGWLARGVVYLLLAALVAGIPTGTQQDEHADKQGAFAALADTPWGEWLLVVLAAGMLGFAAWRLWSAVRGTEEKTNRRLGWVVSAIVYVGLAYLAFGVVRGGEGGRGEEKALTARVLTWSFGQLVVGAIALFVLAVAANYVRKGVKKRFLRDIDERAVPENVRTPVRVLGVVGWLGRALVWALVGWFLLRAAVQHDPNEPVGLDETLHVLAGRSWGVALLWISCFGMLAYALLCFATARWPDPEPDS